MDTVQQETERLREQFEGIIAVATLTDQEDTHIVTIVIDEENVWIAWLARPDFDRDVIEPF